MEKEELLNCIKAEIDYYNMHTKHPYYRGVRDALWMVMEWIEGKEDTTINTHMLTLKD